MANVRGVLLDNTIRGERGKIGDGQFGHSHDVEGEVMSSTSKSKHQFTIFNLGNPRLRVLAELVGGRREHSCTHCFDCRTKGDLPRKTCASQEATERASGPTARSQLSLSQCPEPPNCSRRVLTSLSTRSS